MSDDKVGALHLNNMINVKVRFKTLYNTNVSDQAEYEGEISTIREILMIMKYKKAQLFYGVEQGKGKR